MNRRVRVVDAAYEAIVRQLEGSSVSPESFVASDLAREVRFLADHFAELPVHGPGVRHTQHEPEIVALFHMFAALGSDGSVVVY